MRSDPPETPASCGGREPVVIGHERAEIRTELLGAREVDGVERAMVGRKLQSSRVEGEFDHTQQVHPHDRTGQDRPDIRNGPGARSGAVRDVRGDGTGV